MPQKKSKTFITRPQSNAELYQSFRKTLHGLASEGVQWEDFFKLEEVYKRKTHTPGSFVGGASRPPLLIKRSDALSYEIYLEWINWFQRLPDGSYDRSAYPRSTPDAATILKARSYDATMIELVYNFKARKFELWVNINLASSTTRGHMSNYLAALSYNARSQYSVTLGDEGRRTVEVPLYRFDMGEYYDKFDARSRYSGDIVDQMDTAMNSWRKALGRSIKKNTRHTTVTRLLTQARDFAVLARRNMTLDLEEELAYQRVISPHTMKADRWIHVVDKTHDEEAFYNMILDKPDNDRKRMYHVFKELEA